MAFGSTTTLSRNAPIECLECGREGGGAGRSTGSEDKNEGLIRGRKEKAILDRCTLTSTDVVQVGDIIQRID